jgi:putative addiction module component (TIGR02574 family)
MAMDQVIIEREAMSLPPRERALLADALLVSLDDEFVRDIEAAWTQEAEARLAAYHRGETTVIDGPLVLREMRNRYAK